MYLCGLMQTKHSFVHSPALMATAADSRTNRGDSDVILPTVVPVAMLL